MTGIAKQVLQPQLNQKQAEETKKDDELERKFDAQLQQLEKEIQTYKQLQTELEREKTALRLDY